MKYLKRSILTLAIAVIPFHSTSTDAEAITTII